MRSKDKALIVHSKKSRRDYHHLKGKHSHQKDNPRRYNRVISSIRCFTCDEKGHISRFSLETKVALTRRRETREYIILMLQRMMNLPRRESNNKVKILQVMKSMFWFLPSRELSHMGARIGLSIVGLPNIWWDSKNHLWNYQNMSHPTRWNLGMTTNIQ